MGGPSSAFERVGEHGIFHAQTAKAAQTTAKFRLGRLYLKEISAKQIGKRSGAIDLGRLLFKQRAKFAQDFVNDETRNGLELFGSSSAKIK